MRWPGVSAGAWKVLLSVIALFVSGLWMTELWYAPRTLAPGAAGTLGIKYHELAAWGRSRYVIDEIAPDSPLHALGARVGDVWMPDRPYDAARRLEAHEHIGLTLVQDAASRHVTVEAALDPKPTNVGLYVTAWIISLCSLVVGLLVGFRQPNSVAVRALSLAMVLLVAFKALPTYVILPAGTAFFIQHACWGPGYAVMGSSLLVFFFYFPDDQPRGTALKRWLLRYVVPIYAVLTLALMATSVARAAGYHVPLFSGLFVAAAVLYPLMAFSIMGNNWRSSQGDVRERHLWIILAFGALVFVPLGVATLRVLAPDSPLLPIAWKVARATTLLSLLTLSYAALRHRVLSLGFAVNRVMVYSAASIAMLLAFGLIEWAAHHLLEFTGRERSVLLDGAIALGVFLVFHRLRNVGEKLIDRLFFHSWHVKEEDLRKFVKEAPFITRPEALLKAFATALERFTDGARYVMYRRTTRGDYERVIGTLTDAPQRVDADEPLAVALRASQATVHCSDARSSLPGELALPSIHHGELDGFVVLGSKPNGDTYRPDEKEVLGYAAHQVGLDVRALRMEQLEREVADQNSRIRDLEARLQPVAQSSDRFQ